MIASRSRGEQNLKNKMSDWAAGDRRRLVIMLDQE